MAYVETEKTKAIICVESIFSLRVQLELAVTSISVFVRKFSGLLQNDMYVYDHAYMHIVNMCVYHTAMDTKIAYASCKKCYFIFNYSLNYIKRF